MGDKSSASTGLQGLIAIVREDWIRHRRDWTRPGFRALAVYRLGAWERRMPRHDLRSKAARRLVRITYRSLQRYIRLHYGIELRAQATVGRRLFMPHSGSIVIHREAVIGDDCTIRQGVTIGAAANRRTEVAPSLGDRVDVGAGAAILGPITIGDNVRIGPNAVVLTDISSNSTVFAPPARVIHRPVVHDNDQQRAETA